MNDHSLPKVLNSLRKKREAVKMELKGEGKKRKILSDIERKNVLSKTGGRCHICGGEINDRWQADHVLAHSGGGEHSVNNYLPAHSICNNYRWDYLPEEIQLIMKIGVWARTQIENETKVGKVVAEGFSLHEKRRVARQVSR